jgi:hypothetical protein
MTAPAEKFDECFKATQRKDATLFVAAGHVIDEKLKSTK